MIKDNQFTDTINGKFLYYTCQANNFYGWRLFMWQILMCLSIISKYVDLNIDKKKLNDGESIVATSSLIRITGINWNYRTYLIVIFILNYDIRFTKN